MTTQRPWISPWFTREGFVYRLHVRYEEQAGRPTREVYYLEIAIHLSLRRDWHRKTKIPAWLFDHLRLGGWRQRRGAP